jgi:hypothetical protein
MMTQIEIYELQIKIMQNTIETQEAIIELLNLEIKEIKKQIKKL